MDPIHQQVIDRERARRAAAGATARVGDTVDVTIFEPGGAVPREAGRIRGIVLNAGAEYDVIIHPAEDTEDVAHTLFLCDMSLDDVREGPVHVLRNCQPEWLTLVRREQL
jgi:hypothetical protein